MRIAVRLLTALALVGVAVVHLRIAHSYTSVGDHPLALSDQFYAQSVIALLLAAALLVRPAGLVWAASVLFALGSLAVLVYSRSHTIPVYGFSGGFQESWDVKGAKLAAAFESAALLLSLIGTVLPRKDSSGLSGG